MTDLKEFLQSVKSPKGSQNLYEHFSNIFTKILLEHPKNAYDFFEDYSFDIKSNGYDYRQSQDQFKKKGDKFEEIKDYAVKSRALIEVFQVFESFLMGSLRNSWLGKAMTSPRSPVLADTSPISWRRPSGLNGQGSTSARSRVSRSLSP